MTHKKILERAIQRAIDGGWYVKGGKVTEMHFVPNAGKGIWSQIYTWQKEDENTLGTGLHIVGGLYDFIFDHDFAKALWPKVSEYSCICEDKSNCKCGSRQYEWKSKLQQMVISDDPIAYLGEHLD